MAQANQALVDKLLAGQLDLLRLEASARNAAFRLLTQLETRLKQQLARTDLTVLGRRRLSQLLRQTDDVIDRYYERVDAAASRALSGASRAQANLASDALDQHFIGSVDASLPPTGEMATLASDTLIFGAPSADWWAKQADDLKFKFSNLVRQAVAQGSTLGDATRQVADLMDTARSHARSLVHTSIMEVAAETRKATYQANDDVVEGIQQVSTLDSSTTDICIAYDGATFSLDGEPTGDTDLPYNGGVPRHWGCRSVEVPITKTFKELGLDVPEPEGGERASADGPVPADTTFADFLDRMGKDFQDETLGAG